MYEQFTGDFPYRDSGSRQVQCFVNFQATILLHLLYTTYSGIKTLFLILNSHMLRAQYLGMSLATVIIM